MTRRAGAAVALAVLGLAGAAQAAGAASFVTPLAPLFPGATLADWAGAASAGSEAGTTAPVAPVRFGPRRAVPQLPCSKGDRPETGMQGRVPPADIASGRAALGYNCNLEVVGQFPLQGGATLDSYENCAYYGRGAGAGGTQVLDVSDPANPMSTDMLETRAALDPWESLRVNQKRGLLVADSNFNNWLDIYDVSKDCRHPQLLSSTNLAPAQGHEGWFSPDGMTYYMSRTGPDGTPTVFPVDISDPAHPHVLANWTFDTQTHGGFTTEDGRTSFICEQQTPPKDALLIVDTSDIADRKPNPQPRVITRIGLQDNQWCQSALRVTYDGHPYLIQYGERSGANDCSHVKDNWATFGYPRFYDLADERHPRLVATAMLQSALPEHCSEVHSEGAINGLGYSVHHCSVDRLYDPTILACSWFFAGMRVLDIRDPHHPVEIGYYNPGLNTAVGTAPRPVIRAERGEIWFANDFRGFYVVKFRNGLWPFKDSARCPEFDDHYYAQYNPHSTCATANLDGIGKAPPQRLRVQRAPALTHVTLRSVPAGRRAVLRFVASRAGRIAIEVRRGRRLLSRRIVRVAAGAGAVRLPALARGRYVVTVRPLGGDHERRRRLTVV